MVAIKMTRFIRVCTILLTSLYCGLANARWGMNMPQGVTPMSKDIYDLHMIIFWICVVIAVIVFSVLIYAIIMHRKSRGAIAAKFDEHPVLEVVWAIIPFIIFWNKFSINRVYLFLVLRHYLLCFINKI